MGVPEAAAVAVASLATWPLQRVAALLRARPDLAEPPPADRAELARRAMAPLSLAAAVRELPTLSRLVLEAVTLLVDPTVARLRELSAPAPDPGQLEVALDDLRLRLLLRPERNVALVDLRHDLRSPARLGSSLERVLPGMTSQAVQRLADGLGLAVPRVKARAVEVLLDVLDEPGEVHRLLQGLPEPLRARLRALDDSGPVVVVPGLDPARDAWPDDQSLLELADRGLVLLRGGPYVEVPQQVALGLRHPHPLRLAAPEPGPPGTPVPRDAVAASAAAAAYRAVAALERVAEELDAAPLPLLGSGGVGVRELRRVGELAGVTSADVSTLLELASALRLVRLMSKDLRLTRYWDSWLRLPGQERWSQLARAWTGLAVLPAPRQGKQQPAFRAFAEHQHQVLRRHLLEVLRQAPGDLALPPSGWAARYENRWYSEPQAPYGPVRRSVGELMPDLLAEAVLLGLVADGAASPLVSLLPVDLTALEDVGEERVRAQADGTLVCTGTPSRRLRADLDRLATVESSGAATVWRLTEASLTRAYASGTSADEALEALRRWAGELPQAMAYLVSDAARRAGRLRTGGASSYVVAEDAGALADALAALKGLTVTRIAPTVAISQAAPDVLGAALARAGLGAVGVTGGPRPAGKRAAPPTGPRLPEELPEPAVLELARRLLQESP